jgi:hypothetical protein
MISKYAFGKTVGLTYAEALTRVTEALAKEGLGC